MMTSIRLSPIQEMYILRYKHEKRTTDKKDVTSITSLRPGSLEARFLTLRGPRHTIDYSDMDSSDIDIDSNFEQKRTCTEQVAMSRTHPPLDTPLPLRWVFDCHRTILISPSDRSIVLWIEMLPLLPVIKSMPASRWSVRPTSNLYCTHPYLERRVLSYTLSPICVRWRRQKHVSSTLYPRVLGFASPSTLPKSHPEPYLVQTVSRCTYIRSTPSGLKF